MAERQRQDAGDNSQQIQAQNIIVINGIDEKRAREIFDDKEREVVARYTQEAREEARSRIQQLENDLIPKLVKAGLLDAFKDPSIQILLAEAQKTAASTERVADYSLLSELIIHRVNKGNDRYVRVGINRAVQIVDEISDEAVLGLTVFHSVSQFFPTSGNIDQGIKVLSKLFRDIIYSTLPTDNLWLEHLEILDAIRIQQLSKLKKFAEFLSKKLSGYIDVGIHKESDDFKKAVELVSKAGLPEDILCDHELRSGYTRLRIVNIEQLDYVKITYHIKLLIGGNPSIVPSQVSLSEEQKEAIKEVYGLYSKDSQLKNENITNFINLCDTYEILKGLRLWWDSIPSSFSITSVGKVLAHANAQKHCPILPEYK